MKQLGFILFIWLLIGVFVLLLSSCAITHETKTDGKTVIITNDTTIVYHRGNGATRVNVPIIK